MVEASKETRFRAWCGMHGLLVDTDDIAAGQAVLDEHLAEHDRAYKANQLELALAAPNPEGALRFFGLIQKGR